MNLKNRISHGRLVLATSLIVVASVGAAIGKASTLSNGVAHSRIALATGPPTTLLTPDVRLLEQIESARNTQLSVQTTAVRDGRAFYELVGSDGVVDCWGQLPRPNTDLDRSRASTSHQMIGQSSTSQLCTDVVEQRTAPSGAARASRRIASRPLGSRRPTDELSQTGQWSTACSRSSFPLPRGSLP
jgi:hypothetical protein